MQSARARPHESLFRVPLAREIAGDIGPGAVRKWSAMAPTGSRSAVRTATTRLQIVDHAPDGSGSGSAVDGATIELASGIVDFAFSGCGEFLAVADESGQLHLIKSQSGRALFAYPIVAPSAAASDRIQVVAFATRSRIAVDGNTRELQEDLIVLTKSGVLIRLGSLRLTHIERTLAEEASNNAALRKIMASIQLQQVNVGKLNGGAVSVLVARRYPSSLFVTIANHGVALSLWRADTSGRSKDSSIKRHAVYESLVGGCGVRDAQLALGDRCLTVLSDDGTLTWWDWRQLVLLTRVRDVSIDKFTIVENYDDCSSVHSSCLVVASSSCNLGQIQLIRVQLSSSSSAAALDVAHLEYQQPPSRCVVGLATVQFEGSGENLLITEVDDNGFEAVMFNLCTPDDESDGMELDLTENSMGSSGLQCKQVLDAVDLSQLTESQFALDFDEKMKTWLGSIGQDLDDSRIIVESLVGFAKRLRHAQHSGQQAQSSPLVSTWLESIESSSYRWTTFTLLLPTSSTALANSQLLNNRWREFLKANLLDLMCNYLKRGMMRAVSILWQRHAREDALQRIESILDSVPETLPFLTYEKWLQHDVVPGVVKFVERQVNQASSSASRTVQILGRWILRGVQRFANEDDVETALKLCSLLKPRESVTHPDGGLRWVSLRLLSSNHSKSSEAECEDPLEQIEKVSQQLEHVKYLDDHHGFKISLAVFAQETPMTIAMSMLDRCHSAETVSSEVQHHVAAYLNYCGKTADPVLLDYIKEAIDSVPKTSNTSEQSRLIAIIREILDVEIRASATLLFLGALLPPFSPQVKQFTKECVQWDTRQIDAIQEHARLMEIQDMLTSYGIARFQFGDARSGSRLVSHILSQVSRDSAFDDALQLVRAYSHLSLERAGLEYFENMLTIEPLPAGGNLDAVVARRSRCIRSAVALMKDHFSIRGELWKITSVMEEATLLGLAVLELREAEAERNLAKDSRRHSSTSLLSVDLFLKVFQAAVDVFISELDDSLYNSNDSGMGSSLSKEGMLLCGQLVSDLQRVQRMHSEWGIVVSVKTIRCPDRVSERVKAFMKPSTMFAGKETVQVGTKSSRQPQTGKGKKRALGASVLSDVSAPNKKRKSIPSGSMTSLRDDEQQDDCQTKLEFDLHRFATHLGMSGDVYHSLVAQTAAEHGDIIKAVKYSRDLFSRRRGLSTATKNSDNNYLSVMTSASGLALKNISLSMSKYTAMHTDDIYSLAVQGQHALAPIQIARMQAPLFSLELLQYAICFCDIESFEETFLLLKTATLSNDILRFTHLGGFGGHKRLNEEETTIYDRWFRESSMCVLDSAQTMSLVTRFAISEHRLLVEYGNVVPLGVVDSNSPILHQEFLASKRFVTFLVENNADLLSLQVILSMRWLPDDAIALAQTQIDKLISTVFQSRKIDSFLALGLMLSMDQRDAFHAFRRQISRENVAKDFNRFQQLAKIGSDSARAWQQIAFLNQCIELEGNARWWHFLNLLDIECDQKAFQSERRDLNYIRDLVPILLVKSSFDYYTIQEFTRHYQIDDSFPALVYVEALLTKPEASTSSSLEYQDKIVGVLEDIHEQRLVSLLLKTLPKVDGTDYDRLIFIFQLLLEQPSYADNEEVERRIQVLHVLKAFGSNTRAHVERKFIGKDDDLDPNENDEAKMKSKRVCFHRLMSKPREVLAEILTTRSFEILTNLVLPLRLEPDELLMLLLKNVVAYHRSELSSSPNNGTRPMSGSELERLFDILTSLKAAESKITAGEWLAENLPVSSHKLRALEFALQAALASSGEHTGRVNNNTFVGVEALTRIEHKVLRTKVQLVLADSATDRSTPVIEEELLKFLPNQPREVFYELYRGLEDVVTSTSLRFTQHSNSMVHKIADRVASVLGLPANELRVEMIRELLVKDAVYSVPQRRDDRRNGGLVHEESVFVSMEHEEQEKRDEEIMRRIFSISSVVASNFCHQSKSPHAISMIQYLVKFAQDTKPRAGVTYRAKLRAARTALHLAQSHPTVVLATVETEMQLGKFEEVVKELVDYVRHCKHMIVFEEYRVPYEMGFIMRAKKEALVRSLLRQHSGTDGWVLRCATNLMLDFDVQAPDLWEFVLKTMNQLRMYRSLSRALNGLSELSFLRSITGVDDVWESTLLSPLLQLKALGQDQAAKMERGFGDSIPHPEGNSSGKFGDVPVTAIRTELELMVTMLQKCPFLDQIDVGSFVIHLRDLTVKYSDTSLSEVDLSSYAVRCAMLIPRPSARLQAIYRIIQSGAYMQVLDQVCDSSTLSDDSSGQDMLNRNDSDEDDEQFAVLEATFKESVRRDEHEKLLGSPYEPAFLEFLALTGAIDRALGLMLKTKRLEAASMLVELYYESNPERAPPDWSVDASNSGAHIRWKFLQQYVARSTSHHLAEYRQPTES